jgi:superfamily II DNA or RNA helicase
MNYDPWDHQLKAYNEIMTNISKGTRSQVCVIPTRGGKSWIIARLAEHFKKYGRVYFVAHTNILIRQMSEELTMHEIKHGVMAQWAPRQYVNNVQVISKDTLIVRLKTLREQGRKDPVLLLIDEAHLAMAKTYRKIIDTYKDSILVGFTASLCRLDNKPLGDIFDNIVTGPQRRDLINKKILSPSETLAVKFNETGLDKRGFDYNKKLLQEVCDKPKILADIANHWEKVALGKKTLTFCATIKHAEDMAKEFNSRGFSSICISSKDSHSVIIKKLEDFYSGKYINLCSVDLFIMGFTIRECECIIQARPTRSLMIYLQMIGRGGMYIPGKVLINIDAVNNWKRHGLPDDDREWSLDGSSKDDKGKSSYKRCPDCFHPVPVSVKVCQYCGHEFTSQQMNRIPEQKEGVLVNVRDWRQRQDLVIQIARGAANLKQAVKIARENGIKHTEAFYIWTKVLKNKPDTIVDIRRNLC